MCTKLYLELCELLGFDRELTKYGDIQNAIKYLLVIKEFNGDNCDLLTWVINDGVLEFFVDCSDTFAWGIADAEPLTLSDIPALMRAKKDLPNGDWPVLWCARKRKCVPMQQYLALQDAEECLLFTEIETL